MRRRPWASTETRGSRATSRSGRKRSSQAPAGRERNSIRSTRKSSRDDIVAIRNEFDRRFCSVISRLFRKASSACLNRGRSDASEKREKAPAELRTICGRNAVQGRAEFDLVGDRIAVGGEKDVLRGMDLVRDALPLAPGWSPVDACHRFARGTRPSSLVCGEKLVTDRTDEIDEHPILSRTGEGPREDVLVRERTGAATVNAGHGRRKETRLLNVGDATAC